MKLRRILAAFPLLLCLGAASSTSSEPTVTFTLKKGYDRGWGFGRGSSQAYVYAFDGPQACKTRKAIAIFSGFTGAAKTKKVPAARTILLEAKTRTITGSGWGTSTVIQGGGMCQNTVRFTPIEGHSYNVVQEVVVGSNCRIVVTDLATGTPPVDLLTAPDMVCGGWLQS